MKGEQDSDQKGTQKRTERTDMKSRGLKKEQKRKENMYVKQDGEKRQKCSRSKYKPEKNKSNKFYKFENKEI